MFQLSNVRSWIAALGLIVLVLVGVFGFVWTNRWQELRSVDGGFRLLLPGKPIFQEKIQRSPVHPVLVNTFALDKRTHGYAIAYNDVPVAIQKEITREAHLTAVRDEMIQSRKGKLISEVTISVNGHPGLEIAFSLTDPPGTAIVRIFRVNARLYQLLVLGAKVDAQSQDVRRFLDSFEIVDPATAPAALPDTPPPQPLDWDHVTSEELIAYVLHPTAPGAQRKVAIRALGKRGPNARDSFPRLAEMASSPRWSDSRAELLAALGSIDGREAAPLIIRAMKEDPDRQVRVHAVELLGGLRPVLTQTVTALLEDKQEPRAIKRATLVSLGQLGSEARTAVSALAQVVQSYPDDDLRIVAGEALSNIDPVAAVPALIKALRNDRDYSRVRTSLVKQLGKIKPVRKEIVDALIEALMKREHTYLSRLEAAETLGRLGPEAGPALAALNEAARTDPAPDVRKAALAVIEQLNIKPAMP